MKTTTQIRLNKLLAERGLASRRGADKLIEDGLVSVNGKKVYELGIKVDPTTDKITVSGKPIRNWVRVSDCSPPFAMWCCKVSQASRLTNRPLKRRDAGRGQARRLSYVRSSSSWTRSMSCAVCPFPRMNSLPPFANATTGARRTRSSAGSRSVCSAWPRLLI